MCQGWMPVSALRDSISLGYCPNETISSKVGFQRQDSGHCLSLRSSHIWGAEEYVLDTGSPVHLPVACFSLCQLFKAHLFSPLERKEQRQA